MKMWRETDKMQIITGKAKIVADNLYVRFKKMP